MWSKKERSKDNTSKSSEKGKKYRHKVRVNVGAIWVWKVADGAWNIYLIRSGVS